jgi:hypothetical protein
MKNDSAEPNLESVEVPSPGLRSNEHFRIKGPIEANRLLENGSVSHVSTSSPGNRSLRSSINSSILAKQFGQRSKGNFKLGGLAYRQFRKQSVRAVAEMTQQFSEVDIPSVHMNTDLYSHKGEVGKFGQTTHSISEIDEEHEKTADAGEASVKNTERQIEIQPASKSATGSDQDVKETARH